MVFRYEALIIIQQVKVRHHAQGSRVLQTVDSGLWIQNLSLDLPPLLSSEHTACINWSLNYLKVTMTR